MVTKEEVEKLMLRYFPSCPLCGANKGYEISGWSKNCVQCRSCGAKWVAYFPSRKRKEIASLQLLKPSRDGHGASLKKKPHTVEFWKNPEAIEHAIKGGGERAGRLMHRYLPLCPLCGANAGYEVSGVFKSQVQCRSCGAKWQSNDFMEGKELKALQLWEPSRDGRGASLKKKRYLVTFWQDSNAIEKLIEEKKRRKGPEEEKTAREIEELIRKLKTKNAVGNAKIRSEIQNRLREIGQPVWGKISEMFEGPPYTRKEASLLLGLMEDERGVEILTQVLKKDADEGVRCQAINSLALMEEGKKTGKAIEPLIETLKNDVHPNVRATAAMALGFMKDPKVIDALIQALQDSSATVPGLLARLISGFLAAPPPRSSVGQTAAMSLIKIGKPAVNPLIQAMKKYDTLDTHAHKEAEKVLRQIRLKDVGSLIGALKNEDKLVRKNAAETLGRIGDVRAVEPLIQALKDENDSVRQTAAYALGDIGDARALEALTQAKEDKSWFVRSAAKGALRKIQKK